MSIPTFIVDAFTDRPFAGNPAGVCLLTQPLEVATLQAIAAELNLSETVFVTEKAGGVFHVRYFTPTVEVPFCGHATLAAAKVLLRHQSTVHFVTHHQLALQAASDGAWIRLRFPRYDTVPYTPAPELLDAFGLQAPTATRYAPALDMVLVEVADRVALEALAPDYARAKASASTIQELVVTTRSEDGAYDFYSRCFCPWIGIDEDPVTGAAHSVLGPYWQERLGKDQLRAFQLSSRGGYLNLDLTDSSVLQVRSHACIVLEGQLRL